jgi:DNA integrity scanning protein DisA with diadenylate cyclase activity
LIVSRKGEPKASSVRLKAKVQNNREVELTAMDGGRHRSAAEMSVSTDCVAFVVSDDGPITIYAEGKRVLRV